MNNSMRWKLFISWWNEYRFSYKGTNADKVLREINNYIEKIKRGKIKREAK